MHKYIKYLDEKYLKLLIKKISILEYELNTKLMKYQNNYEIEEELTTTIIGVLSGPSHAEEVSIGIPTVLVVASKHKEILELKDGEVVNEHWSL